MNLMSGGQKPMKRITLLSLALAGGLTIGSAGTAQAQDTAVPGAANGTDIPRDASVLKVCKVAGEGITLGERFAFSTKPSGGSEAVFVPAGPGPGGWCQIVGTYPPGSVVTVQERVPPGYGVDGIKVAPAEALVSQAVRDGRVTVKLGQGVTEVTVTDSKRTGYIEICKNGGRDAYYDFVYVGADGIRHKLRVPSGHSSVRMPASRSTSSASLAPAASSMRASTASTARWKSDSFIMRG